MANFIERTLADAAREQIQKNAAEAENARAGAARRLEQIQKDAAEAENARAGAAREAAVRKAGKETLEKTGISKTLKVIADHGGGTIWESDPSIGGEAKVSLSKSDGRSQYEDHYENYVGVAYRGDGSVVIQSAKTQILTPAQLQNNDVVAAALEKAVKNPMKVHHSPNRMPSSQKGM